MSIWNWADLLDPIGESFRMTLGEGNTPLIRSRHIGPANGLDNLWFKLESANPTGSYKDRFAATAISQMRSMGRTHCVATSSGNTGAALAAYCAAAQLQCSIAIVDGAPAEKLQQMLAYGARLIQVSDFGMDPAVTGRVFEVLQAFSRAHSAGLQISAFRYCPIGMSGVMTISFELASASPQHVFVPAGGGGMALAVARGFRKLVNLGRLSESPAIHVVQPLGNDTIASPLQQGLDRAKPVACTTRISGLQVATVIDGDELIAACRASNGMGITVTDEEVWETQRRLAKLEGVFCEPAGAVSVAGALEAASQGLISKVAKTVCLITGIGFKDRNSVERMADSVNLHRVNVDQLQNRLET